YSEALNEASGPSEEVYTYINKVRERAALPTVQESWTNYSKNPTKFTTKEGLRDIIQRERTIELMFESHRFWDLRRWKTAVDELNTDIVGWSLDQSEAISYYKERVIFSQGFTQKDYLWPLSESTLQINGNLDQAP